MHIATITPVYHSVMQYICSLCCSTVCHILLYHNVDVQSTCTVVFRINKFVKQVHLVGFTVNIHCFTVFQTQDTNSTFTRLIICEKYKSYIFCVVHHLEVEYTLEQCILSMTAGHILRLTYEADLTCTY